MITSFFGAHSFGGDAVFVDRLSRALLRRGHQVDVIYDLDAYELVRAGAGSALLRTTGRVAVTPGSELDGSAIAAVDTPDEPDGPETAGDSSNHRQ